jgi:hypothetical protein
MVTGNLMNEDASGSRCGHVLRCEWMLSCWSSDLRAQRPTTAGAYSAGRYQSRISISKFDKRQRWSEPAYEPHSNAPVFVTIVTVNTASILRDFQQEFDFVVES